MVVLAQSAVFSGPGEDDLAPGGQDRGEVGRSVAVVIDAEMAS